MIPSYTKILTLGSYKTENALIGDVIVQEKCDGSQLKIGINKNKELLIESKGAQINPVEENGELLNVQKLFIPAVKHILSIKNRLITIYQDVYFYCETLATPKHNVLKYARTPKNHIVLFDVFSNGQWLDRINLETTAKYLEIDLIPELYRGKITKEKLQELLKTPSYLGNELVEGVVIKNYNQTVMMGSKLFPLFTKYVQESFKEKHNVEWKIKSPKNSLQDYVNGFKSEARWQKSIIHLKEKGILEGEPKDIGKLILEVQKDIKEEEIENIKNYLYQFFIKDILRKATHGLPEWYKNKLLDNLKEEVEDVIQEEGYCRPENNLDA